MTLPPNASPDPAPPMPQVADTYTPRRSTDYAKPTRAYPFLLLASTTMAAVFCFMYITKPVIPHVPTLVINPGASMPSPPITPVAKSTPPAMPSMLPRTDRLPGDDATAQPTQAAQVTNPRGVLPAATTASPFEETNLRIQHILTAETPDGDLSRIVLNVPVLYQSRNLGWTDREVTESRELLKRLSAYQETTRALRDEGTQLLAAWNHLVERSIPSTVLRADSPSLPANQDASIHMRKPADLNTTDSIQIQPANK